MNEQDPILQRAVQGDPKALEDLLRHRWPDIVRLCRARCGDSVVADDAAQEAMIRLVRFIGQFDPSRAFGPWLRSVVANACRDELARRSRAAFEELAPEVRSTARPVAERLDLQRAAQRAIAAFSGLPQRQRELVDRVDLQGETAADVARDLGLSAGAVRAQLHVARRAIRSVLLEDPNVLPLVREA